MSGAQLRERDLGQLLAQLLEVSADQFGRLFLLQVFALAPVLVAQLILRPAPPIMRLDAPPAELLPVIAAFYGKILVIFTVMALVLPIELAASTFLVKRLVDGEPPDLGACLRDAVRVWPRCLLLTVTLGVLTTIGLVCCIAPGIILAIWFFVAGPAFLIEGGSWTLSFGRSRELVGGIGGDGRFLEVFAVYLVSTFGPGLVLLPIVSAVMLVPSETAQILINHVVTMVGTVPAHAAAPLVYYHLRVMREGHDIERIAALVDVIGKTAPGPAEPPTLPDLGPASPAPTPGPPP